MMQTKVCISVDTEFSIAGAFNDRALLPVAEQRVWCVVDHKSHGLGFMLRCFAQHRITATFFVEALNRHYFKHDPMREIAHRLFEAGHEIQLHVHPCWDVFRHDDWRERARACRKGPGIDDFYRRDEGESLRLIDSGLQVFHDWQLPSPTVFRSASLQHDDTLYRAQERSGIPYSSSVGLAVFDSGDDRYRLYSGRHERHRVVECPILTFCDWKMPGKKHLKSLTITGSSFAETRMLLEHAHREGIEQVVILTHPFEYVQNRDFTLRQMRRHSLNQQRLNSLCKFLNNNRDRFQACGVASAASAPMTSNSSRNQLIHGSLLKTVPRIAEQFVYDKYINWQLARD
jgi:hypothetical protein